MSPTENTNQYQRTWSVGDTNCSAERILELAADFPRPEGFAPPGQLNTVFTGSAIGIKLSGPMPGVAVEFSDLDENEFRQSNLTAVFPQNGNLQVSLIADAATRLVSVTIQNSAPDVAGEFFERIESALPPLLGYSKGRLAAKSRRLNKALESGVEVKRLTEELRSLHEDAVSTLGGIQAAASTAQSAVASGESAVTRIDELAVQAETDQERSTATAETVSDKLVEIEGELARAHESATETTALEASVRVFHGEIDSHREKLTKAAADLAAHGKRVEGVVTRNEELKAELEELLQEAVGAGLFGSFELRRKQITRSKWVWAVLTALSVVGQARAIVWLADSVPSEGTETIFVDPSFLIKVSITLPLLFLIAFCVRQYGRERDFEESYAFKSSLSFSLKPYLNLVRDLDSENEDERFPGFAVETIRQVFESPRFRAQKEQRQGRQSEGSAINEFMDKLVKLAERGASIEASGWQSPSCNHELASRRGKPPNNRNARGLLPGLASLARVLACDFGGR